MMPLTGEPFSPLAAVPRRPGAPDASSTSASPSTSPASSTRPATRPTSCPSAYGSPATSQASSSASRTTPGLPARQRAAALPAARGHRMTTAREALHGPSTAADVASWVACRGLGRRAQRIRARLLLARGGSLWQPTECRGTATPSVVAPSSTSSTRSSAPSRRAPTTDGEQPFARATAGEAQRRSSSVRKVHAVKDVSFVVHHGEAVGIIGRNGSGKSTLLRAIAGLMPAERRARLGRRATVAARRQRRPAQRASPASATS